MKYLGHLYFKPTLNFRLLILLYYFYKASVKNNRCAANELAWHKTLYREGTQMEETAEDEVMLQLMIFESEVVSLDYFFTPS